MSMPVINARRQDRSKNELALAFRQFARTPGKARDGSSIETARVWILAARPKTLPAALSPVIVGTALAFADGLFAPLPALAAAFGALLLQIGSNFANDYFDHFRGADSADRLGPTRATSSGLISPQSMLYGMAIVFAAAAAIGIYLIAVGGWPILVVGLVSIAAAIAYTGGPFPFGYYGLGDFFVFVFFGLVAVCGTYYVQALYLTPTVVAAAVPVGALITAILVVNNLRDIDSDRRAGKRTLAVYLGRRGTRIEYLGLLLVSYLVPVAFWLLSVTSVWVLLALATIPLAWGLIRHVFHACDGPTLNATLAGTAKLSLIFSLLFAAGLVL